jgi:hypothetical protein
VGGILVILFPHLAVRVVGIGQIRQSNTKVIVEVLTGAKFAG